ncbi:MAG: hypothetical protein P8Y78_08930 [Acidihalobacter sp.]|jgi:hypothetical protein
MDDHYTFEDYPAFVALLRQFFRRKRSGMLFAATDSNQMARIEFQQGSISDVSFMHKRGSMALTLLTRIQAGRARFSEDVLSETNAPREPLAHTEEILDYLDKAQTLPAPTVARKEKFPGEALTPAHREVLEEMLAEHIGPVAGVICEEHFASATDLDSALAALAAEIGDREHAERFVAQVQARLGSA